MPSTPFTAGVQELHSEPICSPPLQESGLSVWIGGRLHPLEGVPPPVAVILITVVIALFTEFASNTATIIIFLPVLAELVRWSHGKPSCKSALLSLPLGFVSRLCCDGHRKVHPSLGFRHFEILGSKTARACGVLRTLRGDNPSAVGGRGDCLPRVWAAALHGALTVGSL